MIVCVCKGIGCSKIRSLLADGVDTLESLAEACGAGTDCGSCRCALEDLIEEHHEAVSPLSMLRRSRLQPALG